MREGLGRITRKEAAVIIRRRDNEAPNKDRTVAIKSRIGFRSSFSGRIERIWRLTGQRGRGMIADHRQASSSKDWMADFTGRQAGRRQL